MDKIKSVMFVFLFLWAASACFNDDAAKQRPATKPTTKDTSSNKLDSIQPSSNQLDTAIKIVGTGDNKYIQLGTLKFRIADSDNISRENIFAGIYKPSGGSLIKCQFLITKKLAFVSTFEDLGFGHRGYLYAFNIADKCLIRDDEFRQDYLYSSAGIFIVDPARNKIFSVDKSGWYDAKQEGIVPASLCFVKGNKFENEKNVYEFLSDVPEDTALLTFYNKSLPAKLGKGVFKLPKNWWEPKSE